MTRLAWPAAVATLAGIALALWTIGVVGLRALAATVAHAGVGGFLLVVATYLAMLATLGAAWATAMRERWPSALPFLWARAVREAANDLLPFAQLGGLVFGVRVLLAAGIAPARAYAATIVDLTTEMAAQLLLVLLGLVAVALLLAGPADARALRGIAAIGAVATAALTLAFALLQRPALALASRLAARLLPAARDAIDAVRAELAAFSRRPAALLPSLLCNLAACLLAVASAWVGLAVLGARASPARVLALEALIYTLRSAAFLVPGALGVQEAGYATLGPLLGIDARAAVALSLVKRARDLLVGVPTLLVWQAPRRRAQG